MAYVQIPKDLNKVKTKVAFNLTKRQIIGFVCAGIVGIPTFLMAKGTVPNDVAIFLMAFVTAPVFLMTFYEKDGMHFENVAKHIYLHRWYQPKERIRKECIIEEQTQKTGNVIRTKQEETKKGT